jgi:hypothetical protein
MIDFFQIRIYKLIVYYDLGELADYDKICRISTRIKPAPSSLEIGCFFTSRTMKGACSLGHPSFLLKDDPDRANFAQTGQVRSAATEACPKRDRSVTEARLVEIPSMTPTANHQPSTTNHRSSNPSAINRFPDQPLRMEPRASRV